MTLQRQPIRLVDTSLRDGNQSLWGATGLTTGMVEAVGPHLDRVGYEAIDFTSSTNLSVGVKWQGESVGTNLTDARRHAEHLALRYHHRNALHVLGEGR